MSFHQSQTVTERLRSSAEARRTMLERFQSRPAADSPVVVARQEARRAIVVAREVRAAERAAQRKAQAEQEAARLAAEKAAEEERKALALAAEAEQARQRQAELKLQRDARYLARKAKVAKRG